jgi:hypothetical protein
VDAAMKSVPEGSFFFLACPGGVIDKASKIVTHEWCYIVNQTTMAFSTDRYLESASIGKST